MSASPSSRDAARTQASDLQEFEPEGFELVDDAVEGSLVQEPSRQERLRAGWAHRKCRERLEDGRPDGPADADRIPRRPPGACTCHISTLGSLWMSSHHIA